MGLDMYVYRLKGDGEIADMMKGEEWLGNGQVEELLYWRKFYELDRWLSGRGKRTELIDDEPYVWKWYVYQITKADLEALMELIGSVIDNGVYVYRDGRPPRVRVKLDRDNFRAQMDEQDVNWERDEIEPVYESKMDGLDAEHGYSNWYWERLFRTYEELKEKLPAIGDTDRLVYYPSF